MKRIMTLILCLVSCALSVAAQGTNGIPQDTKIFGKETVDQTLNSFDQSMKSFDQTMKSVDLDLAALQKFNQKLPRNENSTNKASNAISEPFSILDQKNPVLALIAAQEPTDPCEKNPSPDPTVRCVDARAGYVYVRIDPKSFYIGTLYAGEHFRVKAKRQVTRVNDDGTVSHPCFFFGDAMGHVDQKNVWVNCEGLEERRIGSPQPRPAQIGVDFHPPGALNPNDKIVTTRDYLWERFGAQIMPDSPSGGNSTVQAVVKPEIGLAELFANINKNGTLIDSLHKPVLASDPPITLRVRYLREGGAVAVVNYLDPRTGEKRWALIDGGKINIIRPPGSGPSPR
jgi:hypothetical protein